MVSNPNVVYFGWIPTLTHEVIASKEIKEGKTFSRVFSDLKLNQEANIELKKLDEKGFLELFEVSIPEVCGIKVECKVRPSGLTSFSFSFFLPKDPKIDPIFKKKLVISLFDFIRDLYHEHVHHEKKDDAILKPIEAKTEDEAIEKILKQYWDKVIYYHKDIGTKKGVLRFFHTRKRINFLASGLGELVYAQSFVSLHKDNIKNWEEKAECFLRAFTSLGILKDRLGWNIMFAISIIVGILTLLSSLGILPVIVKFLISLL